VSSQPTPPVQPDPDLTTEAAEDTDEAADTDTDTDTEEVPLNRAARRAKAKQPEPSHVGPRAARTSQGRGARSHSKRP
jgi:hypothetical protein